VGCVVNIFLEPNQCKRWRTRSCRCGTLPRYVSYLSLTEMTVFTVPGVCHSLQSRKETILIFANEECTAGMTGAPVEVYGFW